MLPTPVAVGVVASGGTGVRIHHARVLAVAVVLIGISALGPDIRLHAEQPLDEQQTIDELRALAEQGDAATQFNRGTNTRPARASRRTMPRRFDWCQHAAIVPRQPSSPVLQFPSSRVIHRELVTERVLAAVTERGGRGLASSRRKEERS